MNLVNAVCVSGYTVIFIDVSVVANHAVITGYAVVANHAVVTFVDFIVPAMNVCNIMMVVTAVYTVDIVVPAVNVCGIIPVRCAVVNAVTVIVPSVYVFCSGDRIVGILNIVPATREQ